MPAPVCGTGPVSPEQAREMQRKRIIDAMVCEVGEGATLTTISVSLIFVCEDDEGPRKTVTWGPHKIA